MPPHYYRRDRIDNSNASSTNVVIPPSVLAEFDPHGPSPYSNNATLFTVVRNPYARAVSEYLYYHRDGRDFPIEFYNQADRLNHWLSMILRRLEGALRAPSKPSSKFTIDTAGHWNKPYEMKRHVIKAYFHTLGHFIPQYDYVYDTPLDTILDNDGEEERLPPPPKPVIEHVLHYENLHEEFAHLMAIYNLEYIVLPNPPPDKQQQRQSKNNESSSTTESSSNNAKPISLVGVANLTEATRRLIEKVYARDFAAFGYEMIQ